MSGSQHTPGPWQIEGKFQEIGSPDWGFIITAGTNDRQDGPAAHVGDLMVSEADARLISAAPDALLVLKRIDAFWTEGHPQGPLSEDRACGLGNLSDKTIEIWQQIRTAIAKAEGRS